MSEAELRSFESFVLGEGHAAEHAQERDEDGGAAIEPLSAAAVEHALATPGGAYDAPSRALAADDPRALDGDWGTPFGLPLYAIHAAVLPTGKVLWMGPPDPSYGDAGSGMNTTWAVLWDPLSGDLKRVDPPLWRDPFDGELKPANIYCAGQAFLASGELLVAGGTLGRDAENKPYGLNKVYTFDPFSETWTEQPEMEHGRWYPTNVQLPDGRQAIMSGSNELGASAEFFNETIEVFTPAANRGGQGTLTTLVDANGAPAQRGTAGQPPTGGLYPHMFAMPSGKTLVAGPYQADSWYLHPPGSGNLLEWSEAPDVNWRRRYATGVLAPPPPGDTTPSTRAMLLGGYGGTDDPETDRKSLRTIEYLDESEPDPDWRYEPDMQVARSNQNAVLLPDGSMVQIGGGVGADSYDTVPEHRNVELWEPVTRQWRLGAAQQEARAYHSTAVLLPDGRVVSAGDDGNSGDVPALDTAEVYSPPYLFRGPRPTISSAPDTVELSDAFHVATPDGDIASAALIAPGATTHANDMHQRYVPLAVTQEAGGVRLTPPSDANAAPPGYYMLFVVDEEGVPSIAEFVQLIPDRPDLPPPSGGGADPPPAGPPSPLAAGPSKPPSTAKPPAGVVEPPPPKLTGARAAAFARTWIAKRLGNGSAKTRRAVKLACAQRSGGFRCAFELGRAYRGTLLVRDAGGGSPRAGARTFKGACGRLGSRGPRALKTANVGCPAARRLIGRWLLHGKPPPRAYDCDERPAPRRTTCHAGKKAFSFK